MIIAIIIIILRLKICTQKKKKKQANPKKKKFFKTLKLWEPSTNQVPYYTILIFKMLIFLE